MYLPLSIINCHSMFSFRIGRSYYAEKYTQIYKASPKHLTNFTMLIQDKHTSNFSPSQFISFLLFDKSIFVLETQG